jgi:nitroimidazol reductase NimA-like FMN-containing flavoprotein (pyridoxamine 5'-phosphate oxidase superfamily)
MDDFNITPRSRLRQNVDRGTYDRTTIYNILDEALICHVGIVDGSQPFVVPMNHARQDDQILFHGAHASRLIQRIADGSPVCVTATHVDGLVLARSALHHSMNYRSVILFGRGALVRDPEEKMNALRVITEHVMPGRWDDVRRPTEQELKRTAVVSIAIEDASAKIRSGPVVDEEDDYRFPVWAGVLPMKVTHLQPESDSRLLEGVSIPDYVAYYRRPGSS